MQINASGFIVAVTLVIVDWRHGNMWYLHAQAHPIQSIVNVTRSLNLRHFWKIRNDKKYISLISARLWALGAFDKRPTSSEIQMRKPCVERWNEKKVHLEYFIIARSATYIFLNVSTGAGADDPRQQHIWKEAIFKMENTQTYHHPDFSIFRFQKAVIFHHYQFGKIRKIENARSRFRLSSNLNATAYVTIGYMSLEAIQAGRCVCPMSVDKRQPATSPVSVSAYFIYFYFN